MKTPRTRASRALQVFLPALALVAIAGCGTRSSEPPGPAPSKELLGITLTPRSFGTEDFLAFWNLAPQAGKAVAWYGDWLQLADSVGPADVVCALAADRSMTPVVAAQFFTQGTGALLRPLDADTRSLYKRGAARFAARRHPPYLALGIEVNILYEKNPVAYQDFIAFYPEVYDTIKTVSPATSVFPIFQLEKMQGMNGGLFGGVNDPSRNEWRLLADFPRSDLLALTTYPCLVFSDPGGIPSDYYAGVRARTAGEIAFTEIGWHAAPAPPGWESSDAEQAAAVDTILARTAALTPRLRVWSFLYDPAEPQPFGSLGLRRPDRTARPAWDRWVAWAGRFSMN